MTTRILFIDRDGVLIEEPADEQIDSFEKFRLVTGAIPALLRLRDAGFEFVMVTNQDGLGTAAFPRESFEGPHRLLLQVLDSQGIRFREVLIDESRPEENKPTRKPGIGLVMHYLRDRSIDLSASAMVGDRETDMLFATNLGVRGFRLGPKDYSWAAIAHALADAPRTAVVERATKETRVRSRSISTGSPTRSAKTGLGFFDHMLEQLGKHGGFSLEVTCEGDLHIDEHHTVEDPPSPSAPRSGRLSATSAASDATASPCPWTRPWRAPPSTCRDGPSSFFRAFPRENVGDLPSELVPHFFRSLCDAAGLNLHLKVPGDNAHHMIEACFKSVARALRQALRREGQELPSTKGAL